MKTLPPGVTRYATSPEFSERRLPENLLGSHRTKAGTWAGIVVLEGRLRYRVLEPLPPHPCLDVGREHPRPRKKESI